MNTMVIFLPGKH